MLSHSRDAKGIDFYMDGAADHPADAVLSPQLLSLLPSDPTALLEMAHRIARHAYSQKVAKLETEVRDLKEALSERSAALVAMERRLGQAEAEVQQHQQQAQQCLEEQQRLAADKAALVDTAQRLTRDVARLEGFRRGLLQQLQEDERNNQHSTHSHQAQQEASSCSAPPVRGSSERVEGEALYASWGRGSGGGALLRGTPAASPPRVVSGSLHGGGGPLAGPGPYSSPGGGGGAGGGSSAGAAAAYPTPQREGPPGVGPPRATPMTGTATPRIDGKEFFRQARARLSYEQFSSFLAAIKDLNAGRCNRDAALHRARDIFGAANSDLHGLFEGLLSRHLSSF